MDDPPQDQHVGAIEVVLAELPRIAIMRRCVSKWSQFIHDSLASVLM